MKALLKSVKVIDKQSTWHQQTVDILITDGLIQKIGKSIKAEGYKAYDLKGYTVSPGFVDMNCSLTEPGFEQRDDLESTLNTALAGGFTHVLLLPNAQPSIQSKADVEYVLNKTAKHFVTALCVGALSVNREGKDMAEMYDMQCSGAIAFSDADNAVQDAGLMSRAMLYAKGINSFVINFAEDKNIAGKGKINEGVMSTLLGMKGNPSLAEELMVQRDLFLAEYQEAKVHFSNISSAKSVELIKAAKKKGVQVTADVSVHHLAYDETVLEGFEANFKLRPPLRTAMDIKALRQGLKDGSIDAISSQHIAIEKEFKEVEFEIAKPGMLGLQTVLPQLLTLAAKNLDWADMVEAITSKPRAILGLESATIELKNKACLCIYSETETWKYDDKSNKSKSQNSNIYGQTLQGKVKMLIHNNQLIQV
jgi:dihydroorotase